MPTERDKMMEDVLDDMAEGGVLDEEDLDPSEPEEDALEQTTLEGMMNEAVQWRDENLDDVQKDATNYYMARPFSNEEEGRSQVVSTDVRDAVQAYMPSLMRIFMGNEDSVEFKPRGKDDVMLARQQTQAVNYVVREDNDGFLIFHGGFKDALVRKMGVFTWWWATPRRRKAKT